MLYHVIFLSLVEPASLEFDSKLIGGNIIYGEVSGDEEHFLQVKNETKVILKVTSPVLVSN